ncbi:Polygalacturonase protein [Dioscorea alata]|uniref:Polygalacturonase protein n=1 Tax=Dioscorea alata TaxID=55571 RepID=A0ACB7UA13_DIOAL|nr:Polygalacturonase protein [Dioscorea alata]
MQAFMKTWDMGCKDSSFPRILVPQGKAFLLTQVSFIGPCNSKIHVQIDGNMVAPEVMWGEKEMDHWILFLSVNELIIDGSGQIDGQGHAWWPCRKQSQHCLKIPNTLGIMSCQNARLTGLKFKDSPGKHIAIYKSSSAHLSDLSIDAPEDSPNTDGIHIDDTTHSGIFGSIIRTGDDCISIGTGTYDLKIGHVACGPGHGISIGSLGMYGSEAKVEQIHVFSCQFFNTMNGVRIKTWQGGHGYAKGIIFEDLNFTRVQNPIVINQFYCEYANDECPIKSSAVRVSDVRYIDVGGTTNSKLAINLNCSQSMQCTEILMKMVNIQGTDAGVKAESY